MLPSKTQIAQAGRVFLLVLGAWIVQETSASAQFGFGGYGGMGYGGYGGYGGLGYGGYGGMGYGGYGGYGGLGYGGMGYGGYPGYLYAGGLGGVGYAGIGYPGVGFPGVGFPGIGWENPYFSFGLSPLAVQNAVFERTVLGRTTPPLQSSLRNANPQPVATPTTTIYSGAVGTGTFTKP